ncbi:hypothetical protein FYJ26_05455 [Anaerococcus sp. WCA-380-WT-2B]|uniref:Polyphosphate kinase-2-related domain-containing protein n=1 Tax=Anaerococcus porci TaxID=2652269 RepID=A0A6N7VEM6_9FIRM|nr:hypothetical protein [Anaerococcus porci]MSS77865.1 hypothetical protein [Anaerococcus porci]
MSKLIDDNRKKKFQNFKRSELAERLGRVARICNDFSIPILIIVDGWESSGRGYVIKDLTREFAAKNYDVEVFDKDEREDNLYPFIRKFWINTPKKGHIKIFDRSFYYKLFEKKNFDGKKLKKRIDSIKSIEKALYDDQTIILKFFLNVDKEEQKKRIEKLEDSVKEDFYLDGLDWDQQENYKEYEKHFSKMLEMTDLSYSPWDIIDANDKKSASKEVLGLAIDKITQGIERVIRQREENENVERDYRLRSNILQAIDLSKAISDEDYEEKKNKLQKEVAEIMYKYYEKGISQVIVFEGVDAAGKDGAIERLIKEVDPRLFEVHGISAPSKEELDHNYLWRFYKKLPKDGYVGIFSRSWYGRVMVERVEGFAKVNEWDRAYDEILDMEKQIYDHGSLILKFFVMIDKDEQLKRFKDRQREPDKQYKITDEDWRNRKKWDQYIESMNEMLERTNVDYAPWIIVEGNQKKYARIKVMQEYIKYAKEHLKKLDR